MTARRFGTVKWNWANLVQIDLLQAGGVLCKNLNSEPRHGVQIAAGVALYAELGEVGQLLQRVDISKGSQPASDRLNSLQSSFTPALLP